MGRNNEIKKLQKQIKQLQENQTMLEQRYLDLLQNYIILKELVEDSIMEGAHYALAEKKLKRIYNVPNET